MTEGEVFEAVQAAAITLNGKEVLVRLGDRVRAGHPILSVAPGGMFRPLTIQFDIEDATAEPGKKRGSK
jgi:hypothetical protein